MANDHTLHHPTRNRESVVQQVLSVPLPNALRIHDVHAQKDLTQGDQCNSGDPSSMTEDKRTRKQGVDGMLSPNFHISISTRLYACSKETKQYIEMATSMELQ